MKIFSTVITLAACATPLAAQWVHDRTPGIPRTADGKADLAGLWDMAGDTAVGNVAVRKVGDLKPADVQPWAQALVQQRAENFGKDNPHYQCLPEGPNYAAGGGMKRIIQTPAMIAILNEDLTYRQIFTDGRALETAANPSWMGYSVGHWDGDTLVVESSGFNAKTWLLGGYPHTEALRITERYRRPDFGHLEVQITIDDPDVFMKPWNMNTKWDLAPKEDLIEFVCENNKAQNMVGK